MRQDVGGVQSICIFSLPVVLQDLEIQAIQRFSDISKHPDSEMAASSSGQSSPKETLRPQLKPGVCSFLRWGVMV